MMKNDNKGQRPTASLTADWTWCNHEFL